MSYKRSKKNILADKKEKSGKSANFINGILTGILGAWMGLYDFIKIEIDSKSELFIVAAIAFILSGTIGFLSYKTLSEENKKIIRKQKLKNVQLKLMNILIEKKKTAIQKIVGRYNSIIKKKLLLIYFPINEARIEKVKSRLIMVINEETYNIKFLNINIKNRIKNYFS